MRGQEITDKLDQTGSGIADTITAGGSELADKLAKTGDRIFEVISVDGTKLSDKLMATGEGVADLIQNRTNALSETIDKAAGHIPGAVNHHFLANISPDGTFRSAGELREAFARTLGATRPDQAICYCGSGVTACHNLLAMAHAGLGPAPLFVGSWSEWSADPARPRETGPRPD